MTYLFVFYTTFTLNSPQMTQSSYLLQLHLTSSPKTLIYSLHFITQK